MSTRVVPRKVSSTLGITLLGLILPVAYMLWGWVLSGLHSDYLAQVFTKSFLDSAVLAISMALFTLLATIELRRRDWVERATSLAVRFVVLSTVVILIQVLLVWVLARLLIPLYDVVMNVAASGILIEAFYLFLLGVAIAGFGVPTGQRTGLFKSLSLMLGGAMAVFAPYVAGLLRPVVGSLMATLGGLAVFVLGVAVIVLSLRSTPID